MSQIVNGYKIENLIGAGGMGYVYRSTRQGVNYALKFLKVSDPSLILRFKREGELLAAVDGHPNVVRVHTSFEFQDSICLVMEFVEGGSLSDLIADQWSQAQLVDLVRAEKWMSDAVAAVVHLHDHEIVHRDLKPENFLYCRRTENIKLADFGLARCFDSDRLTVTGEVLGTPAYMAPEQIEGKKLDERCDIWALGVIFFEVLTGKRPFTGATPDQLMRDILIRTPDFDAVPQNYRPIVSKCLQKQLERRYPSAQALFLDLSAVANSESATFALEKSEAETRARSRTLSFSIIAVLLVLLFIAAGVVWQKNEAQRRYLNRQRKVLSSLVARKKLIGAGVTHTALSHLSLITQANEDLALDRLTKAVTKAGLDNANPATLTQLQANSQKLRILELLHLNKQIHAASLNQDAAPGDFEAQLKILGLLPTEHDPVEIRELFQFLRDFKAGKVAKNSFSMPVLNTLSTSISDIYMLKSSWALQSDIAQYTTWPDWYLVWLAELERSYQAQPAIALTLFENTLRFVTQSNQRSSFIKFLKSQSNRWELVTSALMKGQAARQKSFRGLVLIQLTRCWLDDDFNWSDSNIDLDSVSKALLWLHGVDSESSYYRDAVLEPDSVGQRLCRAEHDSLHLGLPLIGVCDFDLVQNLATRDVLNTGRILTEFLQACYRNYSHLNCHKDCEIQRFLLARIQYYELRGGIAVDLNEAPANKKALAKQRFSKLKSLCHKLETQFLANPKLKVPVLELFVNLIPWACEVDAQYGEQLRQLVLSEFAEIKTLHSVTSTYLYLSVAMNFGESLRRTTEFVTTTEVAKIVELGSYCQELRQRRMAQRPNEKVVVSIPGTQKRWQERYIFNTLLLFFLSCQRKFTKVISFADVVLKLDPFNFNARLFKIIALHEIGQESKAQTERLALHAGDLDTRKLRMQRVNDNHKLLKRLWKRLGSK